MTNKRLISLTVSMFMLLSIFCALLFTPAVVADIPDGAVWEEIYFQDFEDNGAKPEFTKSGTSSAWASDSDYGYNFTNADLYDLGDYTLLIKQRKNITTKATMKTDPTDPDTPINGKYPAETLNKVKISFNIAKNFEAGTATRISITGDDANGVKQEQNNILTIKRYNLYYTANGYSIGTWTNNTWHKVDIYVDCDNGVYDIVYDGDTILSNTALEYDFVSIYGVNFNADKGSSTATSGNYYTYLDNIGFYTLSTDLTVKPEISVIPGENNFKVRADMRGGNEGVTESTKLYMGLYDAGGALLDCDTFNYASSVESKNFQKNYNGKTSDHVKLFTWNGMDPVIPAKTASVITEEVSTEIMKSKNGADATVVFVHDDGDNTTIPYLNSVFPKYNLNGTVAIIGNRVDETDEINRWREFLNKSNGRLNFACHTYHHEYMGATDDEERTYTWGNESYTYPAGYMTETIVNERARINALFPGERMLTFVKPGSTPPDGETEQVSDVAKAMIRAHYIAMRNTGGGVDSIPPADIYSVKSLMGRYTEDYTSGNYQTAVYWKSFLDQAISKRGLIVYLFHSIKGDSSANSLTTSQTRVSILLKAIGEKAASGKVWSAKFDEAMQYAAEYGANPVATAIAHFDDDPYISVGLTDEISKIDTDEVGIFKGRDMYDYPLTVKVAVPFDWTYVKLTQSYNNRSEIAKTFIDGGTRYVYANVVPDKEDAILSEAGSGDYVGSVSVGGDPITGYDPAKLYYNVELPYGTSSAPTITATSGGVTQASLSSGEGSGFVTLGGLKYEIHFSVAKQGPSVLLRIDPSSDDGSYTVTKKVVSALKDRGISANITDQTCATALSASYSNVAYCSETASDNCNFEFDDTYVSGKMVEYKRFVASYGSSSGNSRLIMTFHPATKNNSAYDERQLYTFIDQIEYMIMQGAQFE